MLISSVFVHLLPYCNIVRSTCKIKILVQCVCDCNAGLDPMHKNRQRGQCRTLKFCFFLIQRMPVFFLYIYTFVQHVHFINKCKCNAHSVLNTRRNRMRLGGERTHLFRKTLNIFVLVFEDALFEMPLVSEDVTRDWIFCGLSQLTYTDKHGLFSIIVRCLFFMPHLVSSFDRNLETTVDFFFSLGSPMFNMILTNPSLISIQHAHKVSWYGM